MAAPLKAPKATGEFKLMPSRDALDRQVWCIVQPDGALLSDCDRPLKLLSKSLALTILNAFKNKDTHEV
jgi:hypothetical protein